MGKTLEEIKEEIRNSDKDNFKKVFVDYCNRLIEEKELGNLSVEQVGYYVLYVFLPNRYKEVEDGLRIIFDIAGEMDIPRTMSYKQRIREWDEKVADKIKEEEWEHFTVAVKAAQLNNLIS